jgi:beta-galactosidase
MLNLVCFARHSRTRRSFAMSWLAVLLAGLCSTLPAQQIDPPRATGPSGAGLTVTADGHFLLKGEPFQIRAGEMHYPRVAKADWRDRMKKLKAMGLNTLTTYVFWDLHEPSPGVFDFSGQNDVAEFLREAQQEGLYVILRPGPYVCSEWDFGGLPWWLLKDRKMVIRSSDPLYMARVNTWFAKLGQVIHPMMWSQGGPILAVQVENEYGAFGKDHAYMQAVEAALKTNGMGDGYLFTADNVPYFSNGELKELPIAVNFAPGKADKSFAALHAARPTEALMAGEYWDGWFDEWGQAHQQRPPSVQEDELKTMMKLGYSFNLYMAEGGTSFGWMPGANNNESGYQADTTSYDYDSPITERGELTPKYFAFRTLIEQATHATLPEPPAPVPAKRYAVRPWMLSASLWDNLPRPVHAAAPMVMEDLDQAYGYVLYRTTLPAHPAEDLKIPGVHDFAWVYCDRQLVGTLDRHLKQTTLHVPADAKATTLEILVENSGRLNYTTALRNERKGIVSDVLLGDTVLQGWDMFSLSMLHPGQLRYTAKPCSGPCFFKSALLNPKVNTPAADTYLNTSNMRKGMVWVEDRPLGRAWEIGPQAALYLPGSWIGKESTELTVFEAQASGGMDVSSIDHILYIEPPASATAGESK